MFDIQIIGAGAAGCFTAAVLGQICPSAKIVILEKTRQPLAKVKVSGGGRCNVTHHCFDVAQLIENYPRGKDFLRGGFSRFQPRDMIHWLENQGVRVKTEADGRMFPESNSSQTIVDCLLKSIQEGGGQILLEQDVQALSQTENGWKVITKQESKGFESRMLLVATGGNAKMFSLLSGLGLSMTPPVPSLFTFSCEEEWLKALSGSVAPQALVSIEGTRFSFQGPLLITHWGLSGPAVLKLSAFAARHLAEVNYQATPVINWTGVKESEAREILLRAKESFAGKSIDATPLFSLSKNLWKQLVSQAISRGERTWAQLSKQDFGALLEFLTRTKLAMTSKSTYKEEFVTCGGVALQEISQATMESKRYPGLFFAGEVLDIDGITGGFNFQNAWTGGWLAAHAIANYLQGARA